LDGISLTKVGDAVDRGFDEARPAVHDPGVASRDEHALLSPDPLPVERVLFQSELVRVGAFRCPVDHPLFADSGPIVNPIFVFPRTAVWIEHERRAPFVADPTVATLYNRGQVYRRRRVSMTGDACDWFALAPAVLAEIACAWRSQPVDRADRPFLAECVAVDAQTYLRQRQLFERLERGAIDALQLEEQVVWLASAVIGRMGGGEVRPERNGPRRARHYRDAVEQARALLARRFRQPLSLAEVAGGVGLSVFHLCRIFRRHTGLTVHEYRTTLRLRHALSRLAEPRVDLTDVALDAGFSSHSHFTAVFRRRFGVTPSAAARQLHTPGQVRGERLRQFEARPGGRTSTAP
jgi:AraC family transcriptional regulator